MCVRAWCAHVRISLSNRRAKRKKRFKYSILVSLIDTNVVTGARGDVSKKRHTEKHKAESQLAHPRKYHNRCVETQRRYAASFQSITMSAPRAHQEIMSLFAFAFTGTRRAAACTAHFRHCCYRPHRTRGLPRQRRGRSRPDASHPDALAWLVPPGPS